MINQNLLLTGGDDAYLIQRSLRFRSSASAYLSRTPASAGNRKTFTWSGWVKLGKAGINSSFFEARNGTNLQTTFSFGSDDKIFIQHYNVSSGINIVWQSSAVYRDPSAWYHIVFVVDTTQASSANGIKLYVNNVQQSLIFTSYGGSYTQNMDTYVNLNTATHYIGMREANTSQCFDGYLTDVHFIDGQALTPSSFGEFDLVTGVWKPKRYAGTYGTNGFKLDFSDNSAATAAAIGKDSSGNGNNWTPNNISLTSGVTYDSMLDVPTLTSEDASNFPVINPVDQGSYGGTMAITNGNLSARTTQANADNAVFCNFRVPTTGKYYWEVTITGGATSPAGGAGYHLNGWVSKTGAPFSTTYTTNDVLGFAINADTGVMTGYKNGTSVGTSSWSANDFPSFYYWGNDGTNASVAFNFGQQPFAYTPPSGYKKLNTFNLPEPTIKSGNKHFDVSLWTGNGYPTSGTKTIVNSGGFTPDMVWVKARSAAYNNLIHDSIRGSTHLLIPNGTDADQTASDSITSFNSNGFSVGANGSWNYDAKTYVGWQWKGGGSAVSNTAGSITSQVSANQGAGFSVVKYQGNGTNGATVGHGLGVTPAMIIAKSLEFGDTGWVVKHKDLSSGNNLRLNTTATQSNLDGYGIIADLSSSTTFTLTAGGSGLANVNHSSSAYIAFCFAEVAGYSKFGKYNPSGEASPFGPFIYLGFRPKLVLFKCATSASGWMIADSARSPYNVSAQALFPNSANAEYTIASDVGVDFLANGFKVRGQGGETNYYPGATYIYAAFAETPFKYANAR